MKKAWVIGTCVLVVAFAVWLLLLSRQVFSSLSLAALCASPLIEAFVTAYLSPARKALLGTSMAIPTGVLATALNWVLQFQGIAVDFPGPSGGLILFIVVLVGATVLSSLGGIFGIAVSRRGH